MTVNNTTSSFPSSSTQPSFFSRALNRVQKATYTAASILGSGLKNTASYLGGPFAMSAGISNIAEGNAKVGILQTVTGTTTTLLAMQGHSSQATEQVIKGGILMGAGATIFQGAQNVCNAVRNSSLPQAIKGTAQIVGGSTLAFVTINARRLAYYCPFLSLAAGAALTGTALTCSGAHDLLQGRLKKGCVKVLFGTLAVASAGYYIYDSCHSPQERNFERHITFGSTYVEGSDPDRNEISALTDATHARYARRWGLDYRTERRNLLVNQCLDPRTTSANNQTADCSPYWNKIQVLRQWLHEPPQGDGREEWRIIVDDDMPVTNMEIDPNESIELLREGRDSSVIVARDVYVWNGNENTSVNTGVLIVRKDSASIKLVEKIWNERDRVTTFKNFQEWQNCPTLGICPGQQVLHEQQGMANVLEAEPWIERGIVSVVQPRDNELLRGSIRSSIAINTFYRDGCFIVKRSGELVTLNYHWIDQQYPQGAWRPGDWMGQVTGVPVRGWHCGTNTPHTETIRANKLRAMIAQAGLVS